MKYVLTLLAICLSFHFASRVEAGEPLILEGNTSLNLPKNKLNPDTLGNALAPGKRKNSSGGRSMAKPAERRCQEKKSHVGGAGQKK